MTTAQAAAAFGLNRLGNDNHNLQVSPGSGPTPGTVASRTALTNRRDAETQAYGSAVLWTGNALDASRRVPLVDPVTGDAGTRGQHSIQSKCKLYFDPARYSDFGCSLPSVQNMVLI